MVNTRLGPGGYPIAPATPAGTTLTLAGFASGNGFGVPSLAPGAVTLTLSGFADGDAFGTASMSPGAVALTLSGFADGDAFGAPTLSGGTVTLALSGFVAVNGFGVLQISVGAVDLALSGFADGDAFGAPTLSGGAVTLTLTGVARTNAFGTSRLLPGPVTGSLSGFTETDRFGVPVIQLKKSNGQGGGTKPGGVGAAQKYATRLTMAEAGLIVSLEVQSSVAKNVNTRMALYADDAGLPGALLGQSAVKTSIVTGTNTYALIVPRAVLAGVSVWAALHSDGNFNWFLSAGPTSRFNADAFADGPSDPFGASTLQNNKAPVFVVFLEAVTLQLTASGFVNANAFGTSALVPPFTQAIALSGFADGDAFGSAALVPDQSISLSGFADPDAFGTLTLPPVAATLSLTGFANENSFGTSELRMAAAKLILSGFADPDRFGVMELERAISLSIDEKLLLRSRHERARTLVNETKRVRTLSNPIGGLRPKGRRLLENAGS